MKNNNKLTTRPNLNVKELTEEQQLVLPFYDTYVAMYPQVDTTTAFRVAMNFAYALSNIKNKAGFPIIQSVSPQSVRLAFDEVIKYGLDLTLQQAVLIPYSNELKLQIEYFGWQKILKDLYPNCEIVANVVYEGEEFSIDRLTNGKFNFKHRPNATARRKGVIYGAYFECRTKVLRNKTTKTTYPDGRIEENTYSYYDYEIIGTDFMTYEEIKKSWEKSKNGLKVHMEHPHEMAKKTIINRGCKGLVRTMQAFNSDVVYDEEESYGKVIDTPLEYTINTNSEEFNAKKEEVLGAIRKHEQEQEVVEAIYEETKPNVYNGDTIITDDGMVYYNGCNIDEDTANILGNDDKVADDGWFDLKYAEYKDNKSLYEVDRKCSDFGYVNGYNSQTKCIRVRKINN